MLKPSRLPVRVAHPARPGLDYLDEAYFRLLVECGYEGFYLQDSPFDHQSGNVIAFHNDYHLISLYDIARGPDCQRYRDYFHEACRRADRHGLKVYLCCWEPRVPFDAWCELHPSWRGKGGSMYAGAWRTKALCWGVPEAREWWMTMAREALAAVPGIAGAHIGMFDNEAYFCNEECPTCHGGSRTQQIRDVYQVFAEVKARRPQFRIAIYDWWLPPELLDALPGVVGQDALVIGRSSKGHRQVIDGQQMPGAVRDMTMIFSGCGPAIREQKERVDRMGLRLVDMPAWSHPNEAWMLPPAPDARYAIEKLQALDELGAAGWYDFDCGATEPGTIAEAIAAWTRRPDAPTDELVEEVGRGVFGDRWDQGRRAYDLFRKGYHCYPIAYDTPQIYGFNSRSVGLSLTLFGPFRIKDVRLTDLGSRFCWVSPCNLVTPDTIRDLTPLFEKGAGLLKEAFEIARTAAPDTPRAQQEVDLYEIYWRYFRCVWNFFRLGQAHLAHLEARIPRDMYGQRIRALAADEMDNLAGISAWHDRNPHGFSNPCWNLPATLSDVWPEYDFTQNLFAAKRQSLRELLTFGL